MRQHLEPEVWVQAGIGQATHYLNLAESKLRAYDRDHRRHALPGEALELIRWAGLILVLRPDTSEVHDALDRVELLRGWAHGRQYAAA